MRQLALACALLFFASAACSPGHAVRTDGGGGSVDGGGGGGRDSGEPDGGGPGAGCPGTPIMADTVRDLDLTAHRVTGTVTARGELVGDPRWLVFSDPSTGARAEAALAAGRYDVSLPTGTYDVLLTGIFGGSCPLADATNLPCNAGIVAHTVDLRADRTLDIDVPSVTLRGRVTLAGATFPDDASNRGTMVIRPSAMPAYFAAQTLPNTGEASYAIRLHPGRYDVTFDGNNALGMRCSAGSIATAIIPCQSEVLARDVDAAADTVRDLDVVPVMLSLGVTLDGSPLPDGTTDRGSIVLRNGSGEIVVQLGVSGPGPFARRLIAGDYQLSYRHPPAARSPSMPINDGPATSAPIRADRSLTIDVPTVRVAGTVTLRGGAVPDATVERGSVSLALQGGGTGTVALGTTGPASFAVNVVAGTYDVSFAGNAMACAGTTAPAMPCNGAVLRSALALMADTTLPLDVQAVRVTGTVTLRGAPMPTATADRGAVRFELDGGGSVTAAPFGTTGPASFAVTLVPGSYDVVLDANELLCASGTVPCVDAPLATRMLAADAMLSLDVSLVRLSGAVTLEGAALPPAGSTRGRIAARLVGGGVARSASFPATGAISYSLALVPGSYVVSFDPDPTTCARISPPTMVPCGAQVLAGCTP